MSIMKCPALTAKPLTKDGLTFTAAEVRARHKALIAAAKVFELAVDSLGEAVEDSTLSDGPNWWYVQEMMADQQAGRSATNFIIHGR